MSRLAKKPVAVPSGVTLVATPTHIEVKGPKGALSLNVLPHIKIAVGTDKVDVAMSDDSAQARANSGTMWSLIRNAVEGVTAGFSKTLEIEGVGYRAAMEGSTLVLSLGYVEPVRFPVPQGIAISAQKNTITITGINKELVGRVASQIRGLKKPEPYKGKGIR
ncbi:MAG: 50S ribosomal protein L6, partial [Parcubacteria group bacterium GW2011_GWB1_56_8]